MASILGDKARYANDGLTIHYTSFPTRLLKASTRILVKQSRETSRRDFINTSDIPN
jgi:hypothetical protein